MCVLYVLAMDVDASVFVVWLFAAAKGGAGRHGSGISQNTVSVKMPRHTLARNFMIVFWGNGLPHCSWRNSTTAAACSCNLVLKYGFKVDSRQFTILAAIQFAPNSTNYAAVAA